MNPRQWSFGGRFASLASKHDKLSLIAPVMQRHLGLTVVEIAVDTDLVGTFSGEISRCGTQWEAAVAKARLGMSASGLSIGIASEGSVAPSESIPFLLVNVELVVLVDDEMGLVLGEAESAFAPPSLSVDVRPEDVHTLPLVDAGFPEHGLIVRPSDGWTPLFKGIHDVGSLNEAVATCAAGTPMSTARVESDLRAHHYPYRRRTIEAAARRLAERLAVHCPSCGIPGWGLGWRERGAACSECGFPTAEVQSEHYVCPVCPHMEARHVAPPNGADPGACPRCNP